MKSDNDYLFDLYVLPSISEGLPLGLLEAMAAGCSVAATHVGGILTAIRQGFNGSLVEPKKPKLLGLEICKVLFDSEVKKKICGERFSYSPRKIQCQTNGPKI